VAARKRPLRSLSILLTALLVNGSILVLVFRGMTHSGGNGRNVERPNLTSSRTDRPRSATGRSVTRDTRQDSAKAEKNRAGKNAKPDADADADGKGRIELAETETTSRAAGSNGFRERQGDSTLATEGEQTGHGQEDSPDHEGSAKPGKDPRAGALVSYEARRAQAGDRVEDQKQLASWCDRQGLWDQAKNHWEAVLRLDPREESARSRLGYRPRQGQWILDARRAEDVLKKKAEDFWSRELSIAHKQMHRKDGRDAAKKAFEAATRVEFVTDPRAVPSLWSVFSGHHKHHRLLAGVLSQIKTKQASAMLSALAVYSFDEKARVTATQALASRNPDVFIDNLVPLLNHRLNHRVEEIDNGSGGRTRILLIEGQEANYQLLYPSMDRQEAASCFGSFYTPGITSRQAAQQFNEAESRMAKALTDQQIESDKAVVEALNQSIADLNRRVIQVLSQTSGVSRGPNPEAWRRWLAERQGKTYLPLESRQKPTLAQVVLPLYSPTFLPIAPAPS
jgi:hypothetical protein